MLVWEEKYCIGNKLIDAQHKYIFEIGNKAYSLLENKSNVDTNTELIDIFKSLNQYTKFHFKSEEDYMLSIEYPKFFAQKREHDNFIKKLDEFECNLLNETSEKSIEDLLSFIFKWILNHIIQKDKLILLEQPINL
ncbi:hypothetical protein SH2C18_50470 [Clostridium sediminicola]|uniref:bacteriohemerythrin n=1 Tax=Clostridium sediminicola TaxID=3114879 RepID=UPI0031F1E00C